MIDLFSRRLIVVTGKGGVGKTTATAAIGLAAARAGKRVCVAELFGQQRLAQTVGLSGRAYAPRAAHLDGATSGLDTMSLTTPECLEDFGSRKLRLGGLVRALVSNRVMTAFLDAVPGMHDLMQLGKIENMLMDPRPGDPIYDLVVLDAPATGHGLTLLQAARSMTDLSRRGPFHELSRVIAELLGDPVRTALVAVTLPEELPVHETLELVSALGDEQKQLGAVIVNRIAPDVLPADPPWEAVRPHVVGVPDGEVRRLASLADGLWRRQKGQRAARELLGAELREMLGRDVAIAGLPAVEDHDLAPKDVPALAADLAGDLEAGHDTGVTA